MNGDLKKIRMIAVVGASKDREKWGYKALMRLGQLGYKVYGVNPKYDDIDRVKCLKSVAEVNEELLKEWEIKMDQVMVLTIVPPKVTEKIMEEVAKAGIKKVWMQTGSSSDAAVKKAEKLGLEVMGMDCIVVDGLGQTWG